MLSRGFDPSRGNTCIIFERRRGTVPVRALYFYFSAPRPRAPRTRPTLRRHHRRRQRNGRHSTQAATLQGDSAGGPGAGGCGAALGQVAQPCPSTEMHDGRPQRRSPATATAVRGRRRRSPGSPPPPPEPRPSGRRQTRPGGCSVLDSEGNLISPCYTTNGSILLLPNLPDLLIAGGILPPSRGGQNPYWFNVTIIKAGKAPPFPAAGKAAAEA